MTILLTRRRCLELACVSTGTAFAAEPQEGFPARPVRIVVPYPAGGPADAIARRIAEALGRRMGQPFVLDHRSGASGTLGNDAAAKAAPDGYTLLFTTGDALVNNSALHKRLPYDAARDLAFITVIGSVPLVFAVHGAVAVDDIPGFVEFARTKPKHISYGSTGEGGNFHVAGERLLNRRLQLGAAHVPYRGLAPLTQDLASGQLTASFGLASAFAPFVQSQRLRILGVGGATRLAALPQVKTFTEQGLDDEAIEVRVWLAVLAPARTPLHTIERLNAHIVHVLDEPEVASILAQNGFEPMRTTPAQARAYFKREMATVPKWIRELGIEPQ